jgi:hypothetical protein
MKSGEVYHWLDQVPAILLAPCTIPDPVEVENVQEFIDNPDTWNSDMGWTIKLLQTGEVLDVHTDTLTEEPS